MEKLSYALGMVIGHNLKSMNVTNLNAADFATAVSDVLEGKTTNINDAEAQQIVSTFIQQQQEEQGKALRSAGEKFLEENAKKENVVVLPSGLFIFNFIFRKRRFATITGAQIRLWI